MNKKIKQYATLIIAVGVILIVAGCYQASNPMMAVSAHDEHEDIQRMLAITAFEVTPMYTSCDQLDMAVLMSYDNDPQSGRIGYTELLAAINDLESGLISQDELNQISYAGEFSCAVDLPPDPARIDDTTDTLATDKTSYIAGDTVSMTATGTNVGDENWHGYIVFYSTDPDGYTQEVCKHELNVAPGATESRNGLMTLPTSAVLGTWSIQSKWIDTAGTVHAMSVIDLGTEEIFGIPALAILLSLLGTLVLIVGFTARKNR